jgi:hypothetical protein
VYYLRSPGDVQGADGHHRREAKEGKFYIGDLEQTKK